MSTGDGRMTRTLADALRAAPAAALDAAGVQLARRYAQLLDAARDTPTEPAVFAALGPKYLAALTALGLVPAGRATVKGGTGVVSSKRDELKDRRRARADRAAAGHPATP